MKKNWSLLFLIVPIVFLYLFLHLFKKQELPKTCQLTMEDSFEKLLGKGMPDWKYITERDYIDLEFYKQIYVSGKNFQFGPHHTFRIPKIVHLIWLGPRPFPSKSVENIRTWISHHPNWTFYLWTDRERMLPCQQLKIRYVKDFKFKYLEKEFHASKNMGEKSDLLRYEVLYQQGGVYIDHDVKCLKPFHGLHAAYDFYAGLEMPHAGIEGRALTIANGIIGIKPYHPLMLKVMDTVSERWERMAKKFSSNDLLTQARLVSNRTYIALTLALENHPSIWKTKGIVFPAAYFYPKNGLLGFYTYHFYATEWNTLKESQEEKHIRKSLNHLVEISNKMLCIEILSFIALISCFILVVLINSKLIRR